MSNVAIVTDNNSGIFSEEGKQIDVTVVDMPFFIDGQLYYENKNITQKEFFERMESDPDLKVSTSMPPAGEVLSLWKELLETHDEIVHIPMSSGLSNSCSAASSLAADFNGQVQVVNNKRISVTQAQSVYDAITLKKQGKSVKEIKTILEDQKFDSSIYIMVDSLDYLKKGGRITPAAALLGGLLKIKPVLQLQGEKLDQFAKSRGLRSAKKIMIDALRKDLDTRFKKYAENNEMIVFISNTYTDPVLINTWKQEVEDAFPGFKVISTPLSLSISCHTGPGCLGIGCARIIK